MTRPRETDLERRLRSLRAPDEPEAGERSLEVVRRAAAQRTIFPGPPRGIRLVLAAAGALLIAAVGLTPAGASVRDWIGDRVEGAEDERPALTRLPVAGRLLVTSAGGAWIVDENGSRRRLGPYRDAAWSPGGLYVAATRGRQLLAVDPQGEVRWSISRPAGISDPRWAPTGIRIVYRSGGDLRTIEGDGSNDELLAQGIAALAPAWRPPPAGATPASHVVAYADDHGRVVVHDVESGIAMKDAPGLNPRFVSWLSHDELVVVGKRWAHVLGPDLQLRATIAGPLGSTIAGMAISRTTGRIALARTRPDGNSVTSELVTIRISEDGTTRSRALFSGPGTFTNVAFSPDGHWLLLGWSDADQWLFLRPASERKVLRNVAVIGDIGRQFDPGAEFGVTFPTVRGWCCESLAESR